MTRTGKPPLPKIAWLVLAEGVITIGLGIIAGVLLLGSSSEGRTSRKPKRTDDPPPATSPAEEAPSIPVGPDGLPIHPGEPGERDWEELAEEVSESVVVVITENGRGSGFVVDPRGLVVTNFHVVEDSFERKGIDIKVHHKRSDGTVQEATYPDCAPIYLDPIVDMALVEIRAKTRYPLRPVILHRLDSYKAGDQVAAIGNPGGSDELLENSLSTGVISNRERQELWGANYIQLDVTLNPGNSGGPIFNSFAEVIGMATWIIPGEHISFAVPVSYFRTAVLEHPYGSFHSSEEEVACRKVLESYWEALTKKDKETLAGIVPSHLYVKDRDEFNAWVKRLREFLSQMRELGMSDEKILEMMSPREKPSDGLLFQHVMKKGEDAEFTSEELRDYLVEYQLLAFEEVRLKGHEINNVWIEGAIGKFNVRTTVEDASGHEKKRSRVFRCLKDRGEWKVFVMPREGEEEE